MPEKGQGMAKNKAKSAGAVQLDFTNVKDGGSFNKKHYPPGDYPGRITKVVDTTKKDDKKVKMWLFTIEVKSGTYPYYCTYTAENQLWKIRNLFIAAGINVPKKRMAVDPNKVIGKTIGVTLEDDEYDGKVQSSIGSIFPPSELEDEVDQDAEEEPEEDDSEESVEAPQGDKKGKKKKDKKKAKKVDDVDDSELEELDIENI